MGRRNKHGPIGLDIGSATMRMIQLGGEGAKPVIIAASHGSFSHDKNDSESRREAVSSFVTESLRRYPFVGREVVSALHYDEFQMKSIRLPRMPAEEMGAAAAFEAQDRFELSGKSAQIRHLPVGEVRHGTEQKEEVIVFASPDEVVTGRLAFLESLRLRPVALEVIPCAVARSFFRFLRRSEDSKAVNVFVEIGRRATTVVFTRGSDVTFVKMIEIGGEQMSQAVSKALGISVAEASELRVRLMREALGSQGGETTTASPEEIRSTAAEAVRSLVDRLSRDIQLCLRYYAVTFRGQRTESLTFVGGEAYEPLLMSLISESTEVPCMVGNPLRGMGNTEAVSGRDQKTYVPAWAVASGLALRGSSWVQPAAGFAGAGQLIAAAG